MKHQQRHKLVVVDNYDSFTFNLVQMFRQYPLDIRVYRCDQVAIDDIRALSPDYILISPGPKDPDSTGISKPLIRSCCQEIPILGVCLGMQCIAEVFGGRTVRAPVPVHGKTSMIYHDAGYLFQGMPSPFAGARYHSLMVAYSGTELEITAQSRDGVIMGLSHPDFPLHGVQFHPESFLTEHGFTLIENFLRCGPLSNPEKIQAETNV